MINPFERGYRLVQESLESGIPEPLVQSHVLAGMMTAVMDAAHVLGPQDAKVFANQLLKTDLARRPGMRQRLDLRQYFRQHTFEVE